MIRVLAISVRRCVARACTLTSCARTLSSWTVSACVAGSGGPHLLWLGSNAQRLAGPPNPNALNALNVTSGSGFQVYGMVGLKIEY